MIEFLRDHGGCTNLQNGVHSSPRQQIDTALATMFREGSRAIEEDKRILQKNSTIDFVALLRPSVAFAFPCAGDMSLHEDIFIELFIELLSARRAWWASPRMPFDVSHLSLSDTPQQNFNHNLPDPTLWLLLPVLHLPSISEASVVLVANQNSPPPRSMVSMASSLAPSTSLTWRLATTGKTMTRTPLCSP